MVLAASARLYTQDVSKDRYPDILPFMENRVRLSHTKSPDSDYVNASNLEFGGARYLVTQAPLENTITDFFTMIYEYSSPLIVTLGREVEIEKPGVNRIKMLKYWPDEVGQTLRFGDISANVSVTLLDLIDRTQETGAVERQLGIKVATQELAAAFNVRQHHFQAWPDHCVPSSPEPFLKFIMSCREVADEQPTTVHCSAGVGRSGTFCAVDVLTRMRLNSSADVVSAAYEVVKSLKLGRRLMVQTCRQWQFVLACGELSARALRH